MTDRIGWTTRIALKKVLDGKIEFNEVQSANEIQGQWIVELLYHAPALASTYLFDVLRPDVHW